MSRPIVSMRVIHVAPTPFGDAGLFGGGERYPLELARSMAGQVDTELVTFAAEPRVIRDDSGLTYQGGVPSESLAHPKHGQSILYTSAEIIDCIPPWNGLIIGVAERHMRMLTTYCVDVDY